MFGGQGDFDSVSSSAAALGVRSLGGSIHLSEPQFAKL